MLKLISGESGSISSGKKKINTWVIPVCEDKDVYGDKVLKGLVKKAKTLSSFSGKKEQEAILYHEETLNAKIVVFLGMGKAKDLTLEDFRKVAGNGINKCLKNEASEAIIAVPEINETDLPSEKVLKALMEGGYLANDVFDPYKGEKKLKPLRQILFFTASDVAKKNRLLPALVTKICDGTRLARKWVSMPSNDKRPHQYARMIKQAALKEKLKATVLTEKQLNQQGFGGIMAVGAGSDSPPCMVVLEYKAPKAKKTVVFVGKGVTFDSGGISLKPSAGMDEMKMDMAGSAAAAASVITVAKLKPNVNVVGVMPLVENMPSGSATRPGDIIKTYSGKTVEIGNTDAEGRLILIDALAWAIKKYKPHTVIDMATLTGACVVALGEKYAGVFSKDDELANAIVAAGAETNEKCWQLPMPEEYKPFLKSEFADIQNMSSSRYGGAISAALFLSEFVGDARWAHIDIAGPAWVKKGEAYCPAGGTGFGVRLFCELLEKL